MKESHDITRIIEERDSLRLEVETLRGLVHNLRFDVAQLLTENEQCKSQISSSLRKDKVPIENTPRSTSSAPESPLIVNPLDAFAFPPPPSGLPLDKASIRRISGVATPPRALKLKPDFRMSIIAPPPPLRFSSNTANNDLALPPPPPISKEPILHQRSTPNPETLRNDSLRVVSNAFKNLDEAESMIEDKPKPKPLSTDMHQHKISLNTKILSPPPDSSLPHPPPISPENSLNRGIGTITSPTISGMPVTTTEKNKASSLVDDRINLLSTEIDSIRVEVPYSTVLLNEKRKEYTVYVISVHLQKKNGQTINLWRLQKRYSDFLELHSALQNQLPSQTLETIGCIPKSLFQSHSGMAPLKTDKKRLCLRSYLFDVLECTSDQKLQSNNPLAAMSIMSVLRFLSSDLLEPSAKRLFNSVIEGYLTKKGRRLGQWKRRYFVLIHDQLVYWDTKEEAAACLNTMQEMKMKPKNGKIVWHPTLGPHGILLLNGSKISKQKSSLTDDTSSSTFRHALMVSEGMGSTKRSILCAESDIERDEWVYYLARQNERLKADEISNDHIVIFKSPESSVQLDQPLEFKSSGSSGASASKDKAIPAPKRRRSSKLKIWISNKGSSKKDTSSEEAQKEKNEKSPLYVAAEASNRSKKIFGVSLEEAIEYARIKEGYDLPSVVYRCIEFLESKDGLKELGIYRLSGSHSVIDSIKNRFDKEGDVDLLKEHPHLDVHAVAGLLKRFLRELPESIFTSDLHRSFLHVTDLLDRSDRIIELARLVSLLPYPNYTLLRTLMAHFIRIVSFSESNKMNARNIGIVFAPTLHAPAGIFTLMMAEFEFIFWVHNESSPNFTNMAPSSSVPTVSETSASLPPLIQQHESVTSVNENKEMEDAVVSRGDNKRMSVVRDKRRSWRADEFPVEGRNPRNSQIFEKSAPENVRFYETWISAEDLVQEDNSDTMEVGDEESHLIDLSAPIFEKDETYEDEDDEEEEDGQLEVGDMYEDSQDEMSRHDRPTNSVIFDSYVDFSSRPQSRSFERRSRIQSVDIEEEDHEEHGYVDKTQVETIEELESDYDYESEDEEVSQEV